MWLTCILASLWSTVTPCLFVVTNNSDQGIGTNTAHLSSGMLAVFLKNWLGIINLVIYACKSLWPLQQCTCIFFLCTRQCKRQKAFFFLFFFFVVLFVIELNVILKMSLVCLDHFSILKQPELGWMEKSTRTKHYKLNGHLSTLCLISSFATFPNSFPEQSGLLVLLQCPNHGCTMSLFIGSLCSMFSSICCVPDMLSGGEGVPMPCVREH